ncbi:lipoprotein [Campylobacterota bacterium]|nr:lipoprotein [Campylobacterota bacterium]GHV04266.1 lipoprotein [Campylobacterota bacterium]
MLLAADAKNRGDFLAAAEYNEKLFIETGNIDFRNSFIEALLRSRNYDRAITVSNELLAKNQDVVVRRYLVMAYLGKKQYNDSIAAAKMLLKYGKESNDYLLIADIYLYSGDYKNALSYYKSAYAISPLEIAVDKIATLLVEKMNNSKEAIAYLQTHMLMHKPSEYLISKLAAIYAKDGNINGVMSAYKRIYAGNPDPIVGQKIVELYLIQNDNKSLIAWLEQTKFNDEILLELYKYERRFPEAAKLAAKLYSERGTVNFLAQSAMMEYEGGDQNSDLLISQTIEKLEKVIANSSNHIYLNYLGYLLIDHNIDPERGIKLVTKALELEPDNPYYTDSLAWGHYRMGRIDEAYKLISLIKPKLNDPAIEEHYKTIKKARENSTEKLKQ